MRSNPRMIDRPLVIHFNSDFDEKTEIILERAAHQCPVHRSIFRKVKKNIVFRYPISIIGQRHCIASLDLSIYRFVISKFINRQRIIMLTTI